jgi:3-hydroxyisobutyrate dehydrogenase/2-hydroxy-3-oxopropionate reductase
VAEATAGTLRILVGGDEADIARVEPLLRQLGDPMRIGPKGAGAAAKLVVNAALFSVVAALGETVALARALGLGEEQALDVLAVSPLAEQADRRRQALLSRAFPPRFQLSLAAKDAGLITAATASGTIDTRLLDAAASWFCDASTEGLEGSDYTAVLGYIVDAAEARTDPT